MTDCIYCMQVRAGTRKSCPLHPSDKDRETWALIAQQSQRLHERKRRAFEQRWAGWREGDGVLLSPGRSAELLRVFDDEGCQIRFDGVVKELGEHFATVWVLMEHKHGCYGVTLLVRPDEIEPHAGVNRWTKQNARAVDRKRRTGSVETDFWAPL